MVGAKETRLGEQEQVGKVKKNSTYMKTLYNDKREFFTLVNNTKGKMKACSHKNQSVFTPKQYFGKKEFICDSTGAVSHIFLIKKRVQ